METVERQPLIGSSHTKTCRDTLIIVFISLVLFIVGVIIVITLLTDSSTTEDIFIPYTPPYNSTFNKTYIIASDGSKIALSISTPVPKDENEKFPVLFNYIPYRKDGILHIFDSEIHNYFVKHGFVVCFGDFRGTGSTQGTRTSHEYSDKEMEDAKYIIKWSATQYPLSNGNIGMFGISWSGINSLILSMQHTQYLKSIFIFYASDDLYYNQHSLRI
eukprot:149939_1